VGKEHAEAESLLGGFSLVYEVLKSMEEAGRVRRGLFVRSMSAMQFALPGADDRLRLSRDPATDAMKRRIILAATDPANPYGAVLPWPTSRASPSDAASEGGTLPQRAAGALVILYDGLLLGWLGRASRSLIVFVDPASNDHDSLARELAKALRDLVEKGTKKVLLLTSIDGEDPRRSWLFPYLVEAGFSGGARGLMKRRSVRGEHHATTAGRLSP
jgi:ATP-dependent helicase Lhr and Lhr-like helicase